MLIKWKVKVLFTLWNFEFPKGKSLVLFFCLAQYLETSRRLSVHDHELSQPTPNVCSINLNQDMNMLYIDDSIVHDA